MGKITKKMVLRDVIEDHPEAVDVLLGSGLHCAMCHMASHETIEQAAEAHGVKLEALLAKLNKAAAKKK
ncbi:MAG: DUF1858 domain-containing protein [Candidatus Aenigmatarchaeota archaeon]